MQSAGREVTAPELVTLGETMATFVPAAPGSLRIGSEFRLTVAGAESTVAIAVARLGCSAAWMGRLGNDTLGRMVRTALRAEGVDVSHVRTDPVAPTGLLIREERTAGRTTTMYYRADLAGARLCPDDVDAALIAGARTLHITGITPALGPSPAAAVDRAVAVARDAGVPVSFDVNYRASLWSAQEAAPVLRNLAGSAHLLVAGLDEAALLLGETASCPKAAARGLARLGPAQVLVTLGERGCVALIDGELLEQPAVPVSTVSPIGAGDSFVGGYLAGALQQAAPAERLRLAVLCGALTAASPSDWEGLPYDGELDLLDRPEVVR